MIQRTHIGIFILFVLVGCAETQTQKTPNDFVTSTPAPKRKKPKKSDLTIVNSDDGIKEEPNLNDPLWIKISEDDGVNTYQKKISSQTAVSFRGETTIPTSIEKVATALNDPDLRKDWVDSIVETRTIEKINAFERIDYNHSKVPWPFEDRDFVYRVKVKVSKVKKAMMISMSSVEDSRVPPREGIVRGKILYSSYWMNEVPGQISTTHMIIEVSVDPMGEIPMWMVNLTQKKWPHNTLLALKNVSMRPGLIVPPWIEDYFKTTPIKKGK